LVKNLFIKKIFLSLWKKSSPPLPDQRKKKVAKKKKKHENRVAVKICDLSEDFFQFSDSRKP
jgi:hypothetical protein